MVQFDRLRLHVSNWPILVISRQRHNLGVSCREADIQELRPLAAHVANDPNGHRAIFDPSIMEKKLPSIGYTCSRRNLPD